MYYLDFRIHDLHPECFGVLIKKDDRTIKESSYFSLDPADYVDSMREAREELEIIEKELGIIIDTTRPYFLEWRVK